MPKLEVDATRFLSALDLAMGHVSESVVDARRPTELASTPDVPDYQRLTARVTYAATLVAEGRKDAAQDQSYRGSPGAAEEIPEERRSELQLWYEWRLAELKLAEVEELATDRWRDVRAPGPAGARFTTAAGTGQVSGRTPPPGRARRARGAHGWSVDGEAVIGQTAA